MMRKARIAGWLSLAAVGVTWALAAGAGGQETGVVIYRGGTAQDAGMKPTNWGSGTIAEDASKPYSGTHSFRISTHGMHQGARLILEKPVDLAPYLSRKNTYLQFVVSVPDVNAQTGVGGSGFSGSGPSFGGGLAGGGGRSGGPGGGPGGGQGSGAWTGFGGPGFPGMMGGGRGGARVQAQKARSIEKLRVVAVTTKDQTVEFLLSMEYARAADQQDWKQLSIPVASIPGLKADDAQIKELRFFGDVPGTVYLGQIRVVSDSSPITINAIGEKIFPRNAKYTFTARASAGMVPLKVAWDFDESDGIQEEKLGRTVVHSYYKTGDFVGTVTVSDVYGTMEPKTIKFKVHITP